MSDWGIQQMIDEACGDKPVICTDCGETFLESKMLWWDQRIGGLEHDIPVCRECWDKRDAQSYLFTKARLREAGKQILIGFSLALFGVIFFYGCYTLVGMLVRALGR
jgi:hypothetical protein